MKIILTGGGTGGHFYPIIAVAQELNALVEEEHYVAGEMYYLAPSPYDKRLLFENSLTFRQVPAGKLRRESFIRNLIDAPKTVWGIAKALFQIFMIYPDVVFGKGGYASFPALLAARILKIPVVIHESDAAPGRVNIWAGKFARRVAISYPEAAAYFPKEKTALTGVPLRREVLSPITQGAYELLGLKEGMPVIFVVGGSQGAARMNDIVLDILPELLVKYQIVHQSGKDNEHGVAERAQTQAGQYHGRYRGYGYLDNTLMRAVAGVANLVITRAGSSLFEIAHWGTPAIVIPIPEEISRDQRTNAYSYAKSGGAVVIEEHNLSPSVLLSEIEHVMGNPALREKMRTGALSFAKPDAARKVANELIALALESESR